LALDFDGVLAPHGVDQLSPEIDNWLQNCCQLVGAEKIVILSNRPTAARKEMLDRCFPGIRLVTGVRKKPYPDGLHKTAELTGIPPENILMADDRLLTGCLAAVLAGAVPFYIRKPDVRIKGNLRAELFFMLLRYHERGYIQLIRWI
jgi:predicted HAD superfamily phosphohydrolase YqeG